MNLERRFSPLVIVFTNVFEDGNNQHVLPTIGEIFNSFNNNPTAIQISPAETRPLPVRFAFSSSIDFISDTSFAREYLKDLLDRSFISEENAEFDEKWKMLRSDFYNFILKQLYRPSDDLYLDTLDYPVSCTA